MTPARSAFAFLRYWPHVGSGKGLTTSVVEGVVSVISAVEVSGVSVTVVSTSSLVLLISLVAMDVDPDVVPTVVGAGVVGAGVVGAGVVVVSGSGFMRSQPQDLSQ